MRTHTSPGQIRVMRERYPEPIRVILPGKTYRYEQLSARSESQFNQVEGLAVGKGIRMTDLIGTLQAFASKMYAAGRRLRVRGSYFPFTEPSIEADMDCMLCGGKGCAVCKYTGWLEVARGGHGPSGGAAQRRLRPGDLFRFRLRLRRRAPVDGEVRDQGHAAVLWE